MLGGTGGLRSAAERLSPLRRPVVTLVQEDRAERLTTAVRLAIAVVGLLTETTGGRRDRTFSYARYLDHLRVGTELE